MYYQNYEDYMRSILGYPVNPNTYQSDYYDENSNNTYVENIQDIKDLEELYPDIFKTMNPIVIDVCNKCNKTITKDVLEEMTDEVYEKIKNNNEIMININIVNDSEINNVNARENRQITQNRRPSNNNQFLRDLIKILILNRIIGIRPNIRPPMPPRPHFQGGGRPPMPPPRPGMQDSYGNFLRF